MSSIATPGVTPDQPTTEKRFVVEVVPSWATSAEVVEDGQIEFRRVSNGVVMIMVDTIDIVAGNVYYTTGGQPRVYLQDGPMLIEDARAMAAGVTELLAVLDAAAPEADQ